jgi:lysophospholipid acyltransferase (LPLAT)-like uncharacterized protein
MVRHYLTRERETTPVINTAEERLRELAKLIRPFDQPKPIQPGQHDRNIITRSVDAVFHFCRKYIPPLHWIFVRTLATIVFLYIQLVALTSRLAVSGEQHWPEISLPSIVGLWHRDAPSLLVAFTKSRPGSRCVIMISADPRGDYLTILCRMLGLQVVRGDSEERGWEALLQLQREVASGSCVFITADGGGPARTAKVGAVALALTTDVPLIPLSADCHPGIEERHKWDRARNPVPFCRLTLSVGESRRFKPFTDYSTFEQNLEWLEAKLNELGQRSSCS